MVDLGSAYFQLTPSLSGFTGSVRRQLGDVGGSAGKTAGTGFVGAFKGALGPLAAIAAGAVGIGAVTGFITDSVSAASDLQQSIGGVDAVFGKSADSIHAWAKEGARSVGLSENEYNGLASVIGSQLKNAGESMDKVGEKTKGLIATGADLSATFGGTAAEAVEAISSALRGERDPIEKYGVSLNQAAVDAEAARLGFQKVGGTLSVQASQAATLALIYKQTSAATGQFAAQTNTLAEQQQIFGATMENVKAKIGTAFLPAITSIVGALSNALEPALVAIQPGLDKFGGWFATNTDKIVAGVKGILDILLKGDFTGAFAKAFNVSEDSPVVDFFFRVREGFLGIKQLLQGGGFSANLRTAFGIEEDSPIFTYLNTLKSEFTALVPLVGQAVQIIGPALGQAFTQVGAALATAIPPLARAVVELLPSLVKLVLAIVPLIPTLAGVIVSLAPIITQLADALVFVIDNGIKPIIENAAGFIGFMTRFAAGGLSMGLALDGLRGKFGPVIQVIATFGTAVGLAIGTAIRTIRELPGQATAALGNIGSLLINSGAALIGGFIQGIRNSIGAVGNAARDIMQTVRNFFPNSPAKTGPFSGSGWRQVGTSGGALAKQFTGGFNDGISDFGANASRLIPDTISSSISGSISGAQVAGTTVLINNKTNVRIEDLIDVRVAKNDEEGKQAQRLGYQPLVFV